MALEVAVARQHRRHDEGLLLGRDRDWNRQGSEIADAGRAAVADEVEPKRLQRLLDPRSGVITRDDLASRGTRDLDPGLHADPYAAPRCMPGARPHQRHGSKRGLPDLMKAGQSTSIATGPPPTPLPAPGAREQHMSQDHSVIVLLVVGSINECQRPG